MKLVQFFSLIFVFLALLNLILFATGRISPTFFWIGLAIIGLFTYISKKFK